jgi:phosphohistidine phosphatase SixA
MTRHLFLFVLGLVFLSCAPQDETVTVLIVRHAEKQLNAGDDPHLSDAGLARAKALVGVAENAGVNAVYVSQFQRTMETVGPLLSKHGAMRVYTLPVNLAKPNDYPKMLADMISRERGKVVLVVSHSNLVPGIVEALTKIKVPPLGDNEYSRLYIVTVKPGTPPRLIAAQYGCQ